MTTLRPAQPPEPDAQPGPEPEPPESALLPEPGPIEPGPPPSPPSPPEPEPEPEEFPEPNPSPGPPPPRPDPESQPDVEEPLGEIEGGPLDCGMWEVSCHVSNWFHDLVVDALNPLFGWLGGLAFRVPMPTGGVEELWRGVLATSTTLFILLIVLGGVTVMGRETWARTGTGEVLGRVVFAFAAANFSLWIAEEMFSAANGISAAVSSDGVDPEEAARNLQDRMDVILQEAVVFTLLLLVAAVVLLVVWVVMDVVRIVMSIVLVIAAPLLLMFHALPMTNRLAELWWRSMAGLCAIPICQAIAFIAFMRLFFEGQFTYFGSFETPPDTASASTPTPIGLSGPSAGPTVMTASRLVLATAPDASDAGVFYSLILFLVMLYLQVRIPFWIWKLVWSPRPGSSPIVGLARTVAMMLLYRGIKNLRFGRGHPVYMDPPKRPAPRRMITGRPPARQLTAGHPTPPKPGTGVQPLQPSIWWHRPRNDPPPPAGAVASTGPHGPQQVAGPRTLPPAPGPEAGPTPRPWPPRPPSPVLGDGRYPRKPRTEQEQLFRRTTPTPPEQGRRPGVQRWRQGVLPTPPPVRVPGRQGVRRLGEVLDTTPAAPPASPPRVRGQRGLFPNPRKHWVQRGLPFPKPGRN